MRSVGPTRIEITGHSSDLGRWRAARRFAEPRLRDQVVGYFASEGFIPKPLHERHLPSRETAIVLNFAAPHRIIQPSEPTRTLELRNACVVGLQHRHQVREALGARDFMVVRLTPIGAQMLLGTPMDQLTDRIPALEDVDHRFAQVLMGRAEDTKDWAERFDAVENLLADRLASARRPPAGLQQAWQRLQQFPNDVDLAGLPQEFGCSRRHLIAQFHKYFGMAPKMIARISRFHLALAAIHRLGRADASSYSEEKPYLDCATTATDRTATLTKIRWTDLALGCGYYDQSHFINEFRFFSGMSPLEFLQQSHLD
jgi:AraC-like DNA-binding protein